MKNAVSIPRPVLEPVDRLAKSLGIPRSLLYSRAINRYQIQQQEITVKLNEVYANEIIDLDPVMAALQVASVLHEPW